MPDQHPTYENGADIRQRSFEFACRVTMFCRNLYEDGGISRIVVAQLVACSCSYASMLQEARAAESDRDFISKCSISLKEIREAHVRLRICERCRLGPAGEAKSLVREANELVAITTAILRNKKRNSGQRR